MPPQVIHLTCCPGALLNNCPPVLLQHIYAPASPRAQAAAYEADELLHDMSDVGLKPTVVYHNL